MRNYEQEGRRCRAESWQWDGKNGWISRVWEDGPFSWLCLLFYVAVSALSFPLLGDQPCSSQVPRIPPDSAGLSSHRAEGPRPGHSEAAATGEGRHHHTECRSPSSRGPVHLGGGRGEVRTSPWKPLGSAFHSQSSQLGVSPESILFRMVRAHFRNASSTFSPVRALVSRNISSGGGRGTDTQDSQGLSQSSFHSDSDLLPLILSLKPSLRASIHVFSCHESLLPQVPTELFLQNSAPISSSRKSFPG